MIIIKYIMILFSVAIMFSCDNPFLPPTGVPFQSQVKSSRATPAGVISLLFQSYEQRRIELFSDVILKDKFKFYTASDYDRTRLKELLSEKPDTFMLFVEANSLYYYWGYEREINSTKRLFTSTDIDKIEIPSKPVISDINYNVNPSGDTVYAELKIQNYTIEVSKYENGRTTLITYPVVNQPQVFLLQRDEKKQWVISKWYDLGRIGDR